MHDAVTDRSDLPADVLQSPLFNHDLAPVPQAQRNWTTYNFAALWISMAHCIPTYAMAGAMLVDGMNWWQAILTIGLGTIIVLIPILLNAHPGTKYGIPFPVYARASFGTTGANVPAVLRALVACGWFGIQTFIGGEAVKSFITAIWPEYANLGGDFNIVGLSLSSAITFGIFWGLQIWIIFKGMNAVRVFENWAAPIVLVMAAILLIWAVAKAEGFGPLLDAPSKFDGFSDFWAKFAPHLTGVVAFWSTLSLNIPDFTRYGRGQKEQIRGQTIGLPPTMILFSLMGLIITSASRALLPQAALDTLWYPDTILHAMTSGQIPAGGSAPLIASEAMRVIIAVVALVGIGIATISVNIAANVVSPANDFANLAPKKISFKTGALITGILGIVILPWKLWTDSSAYVLTWLGGYGSLLGPIAAIMIADYFVLRKRELDVPDLYRVNGRYAGTNPNAVLALVLGVLPNVPGLLHSAKITEVPQFFVDIYPYTWFTGFGLAFVLYLGLMRVMPWRRA